MSFRGNNFNDRIADQKKAKLELLKRAKEKQIDPEVKAKLAAERIERNRIRDEKRVKAEADRIERERVEVEEASAKAEASKLNAEKLKNAQKARRDAKYAARKARR